jgi:hypothetical protein
MDFTKDPRYQAIAEAYALDAVDTARTHFKIELDWSDQSIKRLESILDRYSRDMAKAQPTDQEVMNAAKMWGSYLGEVYRKNHGAEWVLIKHDGHTFPGLQAKSGTLFWPWGKVESRLRNGAEGNIWHYYLHLTGKLGS